MQYDILILLFFVFAEKYSSDENFLSLNNSTNNSRIITEIVTGKML